MRQSTLNTGKHRQNLFLSVFGKALVLILIGMTQSLNFLSFLFFFIFGNLAHINRIFPGDLVGIFALSGVIGDTLAAKTLII